jgi:hypothetical protein
LLSQGGIQMLRRLFIVFILISTFAVAGCKIAGTITTEDGEGVGGVTVYLDAEGEDGNASIMAITDADGAYAFEGFHHGTLTITPEKPGYTFSPESQKMTVGFFENVLDVDFEAKEPSPEPEPEPSEKAEVPWSTYQGNAAHTGYVPVYLNRNEFAHRWTWPANADERVLINPVAAGDGKVFVTTAWDSGVNVLMALDTAAGGELWRYDFGNIDSINSPAYANGTVYVQSGVGQDSSLWAFDAEQSNTADVAYESETYFNRSFLFYAPTVYEKIVNNAVSVDVYIGGEYSVGDSPSVSWFGGAYGFNFGDTEAREQWRSPLPPFEQWTPAVNETYVIAYTGPYSHNMVFNHLTVLDRLTGGVMLSIRDEGFVYNTPDYFVMNLAPVLGGANNVIVINGGRLINFDLTDEDEDGIGDIKWQKDGGFIGQPSVANGTIYAFHERSLQAIDESSGDPAWEWQPPDEGEDGNEDEDGDGSEDGNDNRSDDEYINDPFPMLVTDNLIFVSTESTTYAVDLESQTDVWDYPAGGHLALSNDGILFIATAEGELHAISTIDMPLE